MVKATLLQIFLNDTPTDLTSGYYLLAVMGALLFLYLIYLFSFYEYNLYNLTRGEMQQIIGSKSTEYDALKQLLKQPESTLGSLVSGYYLSMALGIICLFRTTDGLLSHTALKTAGDLNFAVYALVNIGVVLVLIPLVSDALPLKMREKKVLHRLYRRSRLMCLLVKLLSPLSWILCHGTRIITKRLEAKSEHILSLDELSQTLNTEKIQQNEDKAMLEGIVDFGNICVDEIMRPRVDIVQIDQSMAYDKVLDLVKESEYSRLPVCEGGIDNVKGILYVKDLLSYIEEKPNFAWQKLVREPYFVPETKKIDDLLKDFQNKHIHMAVVVDEFGGTSGLVTLENILEVIVGDIVDEHDDDQKMYSKLDSKNLIIDGKMPLTDFYKIEGIEKEEFSEYDSDADTVAGLLLEIKGDIPQVGEKIEKGAYQFQIVNADRRRIKKIKLKITEKE